MLTPSLTTLPNAAWEAIFALLTAWFGWTTYREARAAGAWALTGGHHPAHLAHAAAMAYMYLALAASPGAAMQTLRLPTLALTLALLLAGYTVRDLDQLSGPAGRKHHSRTFAALAPTGVTIPAAAPANATAQFADTSSARPLPPQTSRTTTAQPRQTGTGPVARIHDRTSATGSAMASRLLLTPQVAINCRTAMGLTMAFMLIIMI